MPLRIFKGHDGQEWRVWFVMPGNVVSLGAMFRDGWLCFERLDGSDRRRLAIANAPTSWETLSEEQLDRLRVAAEPAQFNETSRGGARAG